MHFFLVVGTLSILHINRVRYQNKTVLVCKMLPQGVQVHRQRFLHQAGMLFI